jgi:hypothetical protein
MLAMAVAYERIVRRDGYYVMLDPGITPNRFGWSSGAGLTLTTPDATVIDLGAEAEDEEEP